METNQTFCWVKKCPHLVSGPSLPSQRSGHSWWPLLSVASCCRDAGGTVMRQRRRKWHRLVFRLTTFSNCQPAEPAAPLSPTITFSLFLSHPADLTSLLSLPLQLFPTSLMNFTPRFFPPSFTLSASASLLLLLLLFGCCGFLQLFSLEGNGGRKGEEKHTGQWMVSSATHCSDS